MQITWYKRKEKVPTFEDKINILEVAPANSRISVKNIEWEYIHQVLVESDFNISKAARILGMHRRTLARKLEKRRVQS